MSMELRMALRGKLHAFLDGERTRLATAIHAGVYGAGRGLEKDLEGAYRSAGLGKLFRAWNSTIYPAVAGKTLTPAAIVYGKGRARTQGALTSHGAGSVIRGVNRRLLAIPTEFTPKERGRPIEPWAYRESMFGPLRAVKRPGRVTLLVADQARVSTIGRAVKLRARTNKAGIASTSLRGRATIVLWILTPTAHQAMKVDVRGFASGWRSRIPGLIDAAHAALPETKV